MMKVNVLDTLPDAEGGQFAHIMPPGEDASRHTLDKRGFCACQPDIRWFDVHNNTLTAPTTQGPYQAVAQFVVHRKMYEFTQTVSREDKP